MKLLTKAIIRRLPRLYAQEHTPDPTVYVKFFTPWSYWTWYVLEGEERDDDWLFFGYVEGDFKELGYFVLSELASVHGPYGLTVERDLYFDPCPLSEVRKR